MQKYIIGMGNYAKQDDGIGLRILEHIVDNKLDEGFVAIEVKNDGLSVMGYLNEDTEKILIVDGALVDLAPGDYVVFDIEDVESKKLVGTISTHEGDILKIVELARGLGYAIPPIKVLAIQPESLEMEMSLSSTLEGRFDEYVDVAISEIKGN
jgi:hydrogenase maturation protease